MANEDYEFEVKAEKWFFEVKAEKWLDFIKTALDAGAVFRSELLRGGDTRGVTMTHEDFKLYWNAKEDMRRAHEAEGVPNETTRETARKADADIDLNEYTSVDDFRTARESENNLDSNQSIDWLVEQMEGMHKKLDTLYDGLNGLALHTTDIRKLNRVERDKRWDKLIARLDIQRLVASRIEKKLNSKPNITTGRTGLSQ